MLKNGTSRMKVDFLYNICELPKMQQIYIQYNCSLKYYSSSGCL